ncbi:Lipoprotein signal peptidase (plasmid) [Roseomonas mucosa]|uniref:signal peptidase II n=1 Tax=Roseomonas mucosa TaxID=207340 RepID=UPI00220EA7DC|nr:signal peptidase II [Roseomonas mucosa]MDT8350912.1 signal peptidase II [Roseomonas mucosa]MDU7520629.1 signal peptidase II [Roseomonas mucosa]QDJ12087.1 Lipoprotein signal peptidase [Roseomonas mucosa]UZO94667.1 Lipoprotein signal peptidase [Roseomonas mucosa]
MKRAALIAILATVVADQATKAWALAALWPPYSPGIAVLPVLNLRLGFNTGVSFGLFREGAAEAVWLLVAIKLAVVAGLAVWLRRAASLPEALGLGLVIGGALGNIADRMRQGAVTDFLDAHLGGWHWPTFNVADIAIVAGVGLVLLAGLRIPVVSPRLR